MSEGDNVYVVVEFEQYCGYNAPIGVYCTIEEAKGIADEWVEKEHRCWPPSQYLEWAFNDWEEMPVDDSIRVPHHWRRSSTRGDGIHVLEYKLDAPLTEVV